MTTDAERSRVWLRRTPISDAWAVVRAAGHALAGHWPVLLSLVFFALGARRLIIAEAVHASHVNEIFGLMVFLIAPVTLTLTLIVAIRTVRSSLPYLGRVADHRRGRAGWRRTLDAVGAVAVPFIGVYVGAGFLQSDTADYYFAVFNYDWLRKPTLPVRLTMTAVVTALIVMGLRAVLGTWKPAKRQRWLGIGRAYLEISWIVAGAMLISPIGRAIWSWVSSRRAVHWWADLGDHLSGPPSDIADWLTSALGSADTVIGLPIAWLVVAAVVYGYEIEPEPELSPKLQRRLDRLPAGSFRHKLAERGLAAYEDRIGGLISSVTVVMRAGLAAALPFCLLFLVVRSGGVWLFEVERWLLGPRDVSHWWMPVSGLLSALNQAVELVLLVCLVASAADRALWAKAMRSRSVQPPVPSPRVGGVPGTSSTSELPVAVTPVA